MFVCDKNNKNMSMSFTYSILILFYVMFFKIRIF